MAVFGDFDALVHDIYDASCDASRYPAVAGKISDILGTDGVTLVLHTTDTQQMLSAAMVHYDHLAVDEIFGEYGRDWHARNPQVVFERTNPGCGVYYEGCHPTINCDNDTDFRLWMESRTGIKSQLTGYCRPSDKLAYAFAFSSHQSYRPQSRRQVELLNRIMRHLRQSVSLAYRALARPGTRYPRSDL